VAHDIHVDVVATPTRVVRAGRPGDYRVPRIDPEELTAAKVAAIPVLGRLVD
jgi:hypothetical protein